MPLPPLKRYRVITLRQDSGSLEDFLADYESDNQAINAVRPLLDPAGWELWDGSRRIAAGQMPAATKPHQIQERKIQQPE